jgi:hypothetical protein
MVAKVTWGRDGGPIWLNIAPASTQTCHLSLALLHFMEEREFCRGYLGSSVKLRRFATFNGPYRVRATGSRGLSAADLPRLVAMKA